MGRWQYHQVDVFTDEPFGGNPLAVFPDAAEIPEEHFQSIARELNLSETTFVLPTTREGCHFHVRIFTPARELPMAGHPTLGTAAVLALEGRIGAGGHDSGEVIFQEGVGPVPVTFAVVGPHRVFATMNQPLPRFEAEVSDRALIARMLSLEAEDLLAEAPPQAVSCGVPFFFVPLRTLEAAGRAKLRLDLWEPLAEACGAPGVYLFTMETEWPGSTVHGRMFAPGAGVAEDPATGSATGPLGCYLVRHGLVESAGRVEIVCEQGLEMGRPSRLQIAVESQGGDFSAVEVGGQSVVVGGGWLQLP